MSSVNQKIKEIESSGQEKLKDWERTAITEAKAAQGDLSWSEIDVVNEIFWRNKNA